MSRRASRGAPSPLRPAASSHPHPSAAGQIAALGKGFMGLRGSHRVGKEDGKRLAMIREEHVGVGPCRPPPFGFSGVSSPSSSFSCLCLLSALSEGDCCFSVDAEALGFHTHRFTTANTWRTCFPERRPTSDLKFGPLMKSQIPQRLPGETQAIPKTTIIISGNSLCFVCQNGIIMPVISVCLEKKQKNQDFFFKPQSEMQNML